MNAPPVRIERLGLRDFRGIEDLTLVLPDGPLAVLIGANGAGKSSVMDAAAILLSRLVSRIRTERGGGGLQINDDDVRNGAASAEIEMRLRTGSYRNPNSADATGATWSVVKTRKGSAVRDRSELDQLRGFAEDLREFVREATEKGVEEAIHLPLFVHYPTNRAVFDIPKRIRKKHTFDPIEAYDEALTKSQLSFKLFFEWFREHEDLENERRIDDPEHRDRALEAVRKAVKQFVGVSGLRVRRLPHRMVATQHGKEVSIDQMSDGEKCLLALVGDLARRFSIASPSGDPLEGEGVVLIDEVELHLHPKWQHHVLDQLTSTFSRCQFIVTTHSPAVLSHAPNGAAVLLTKGPSGKVSAERVDPYGKEAGALLEDVFGAPSRAPDVARDLRKLFRLIDDGKNAKARDLLEALRAEVGEDADFTRAEVLLWEPAS